MKVKYVHLIVPDMHVPYHDQAALDAVLDFTKFLIKKKLLHTFIIKGDFADFYSMGQHGVKSPHLNNLIVDELQDCMNILSQIEGVIGDKAKKVFQEGNHEFRFERFIRNRAVELTGLFSLKDKLMKGLKGWDYQKYGANQLYKLEGTELHVRHEPFGSSSQASIRNGMVNLNHGHDHRIHKTVLKDASGRQIEVSSDGSLIDEKSPAFNYLKSFSKWSKGFGLVTVTDKGWFHETIAIKNDQFVALGGLYEIKR